MKQNVINQLLDFGFNHNEAEIYIYLQHIHPVSITDIVRAVSIPRTTVVENIGRLLKNHLIKVEEINNKYLYSSYPINRLNLIIFNRKLKLTDQLSELQRMSDSVKELSITLKNPEFEKISNGNTFKMQLNKTEIIDLYKDAFSSPHLSSYVNLSLAHQHFPDNHALFQSIQAKTPSTLVREIIDPSDSSRRKALTYSQHYHFRFQQSPLITATSQQNVLLFANQVLYVNFQPVLCAILIKDKNIYQHSLAVFERLFGEDKISPSES